MTDALNSTRDLSPGATVFAATYVLWHGIVKIRRVAALLVLSVVDVLVFGLTWLEDKRLHAIHGFSQRPR